MMSKAWMVGWVLCLLPWGCGGQAERSIDDSKGGAMPTTGATGTGSTPNEGTPLGACVPGFARYENLDKPCNWLADELCYDTKDQACACICPRDKKSLCLSGFPVEGSATKVSCD